MVTKKICQGKTMFDFSGVVDSIYLDGNLGDRIIHVPSPSLCDTPMAALAEQVWVPTFADTTPAQTDRPTALQQHILRRLDRTNPDQASARRVWIGPK